MCDILRASASPSWPERPWLNEAPRICGDDPKDPTSPSASVSTVASSCAWSSSCSPRSKCSSDSEADDAASHVDADEEEEELQSEVAAAEIQKYLEAMNDASDELNDAQQELIASQRERASLAAVASAAAQFTYVSHIALARPLFERRCRCDAAGRVAEAAGAAYLVAAGAADRELSLAAAAAHTHALASYETARREIRDATRMSPLPAAELRAAITHLEAEAWQHARLAAVDAAILRAAARVAASKMRYCAAIKSLEALSEEEHQRRASAYDLAP